MSLENVIINASNFLRQSQLPKNAVVVFDIDDTLIYSMTNKVITPVFNLFESVKNLGIKPVIVTYRSKLGIRYTIDQLSMLGIKGYSFIYFRPDFFIDPWEYKSKARMDIASRGYEVVMSVGDKDWDISGPCSGVGVKIKCD